MRWSLPLLLGLAIASGAPSSVSANDAMLRMRIEALSEPQEGEADLFASAERALARAVSDRAAGDVAAAERAERIADATVTLIETRRRRAEAERSLAAARARRAEVAARGSAAEQTRASDARERERLAPPPEPTP